MNKNAVIGVLVLTSLTLGGLYILNSSSVGITGRLFERLSAIEKELRLLGAVAGSDFYDGAYIAALRSRDGVITNETNATLTANQICKDNYIELGFATSVQSVTLPSAPSLVSEGCLPAREAVRTIYLRNASSSSGSALRVVAGASSTVYSLNNATTTEDHIGLGRRATTTIAAGQIVELTGIRIVSSTDWIIWLLKPYLNN